MLEGRLPRDTTKASHSAFGVGVWLQYQFTEKEFESMYAVFSTRKGVAQHLQPAPMTIQERPHGRIRNERQSVCFAHLLFEGMNQPDAAIAESEEVL
jgi:hypothetical protein